MEATVYRMHPIATHQVLPAEIGEGKDALMTTTGNAYDTLVFYIEVQGFLAVYLD